MKNSSAMVQSIAAGSSILWYGDGAATKMFWKDYEFNSFLTRNIKQNIIQNHHKLHLIYLFTI